MSITATFSCSKTTFTYLLKYSSNTVIYKWGIGKFFMNDEQQTNFLDISGATALD